MVNILLISEDKIKTFTNLNDNTFGKLLQPALREAQDVYLQQIIGSCLYNKILSLVATDEIGEAENYNYKSLLDNQIQDFLLYQTLVNIIPLVNIKIANFGSVVSQDQYIVKLSQGDTDLIMNYYQKYADVYQKRLQDYLLQHCEDFPELQECNCTEIKPNLKSNTNLSPIFLGGERRPYNSLYKNWNKNK